MGGPILMWVWTAAFVMWVCKLGSTLDLWKTGLVFLVGLYAASPGFGVQWLVWALPFWLIVHPRGALGYSALAGAFLAGSYWQWSLNVTYGVGSLTASLGVLSRGDFAGVILVGILGLLTWVYCVWTTWRLTR